MSNPIEIIQQRMNVDKEEFIKRNRPVQYNETTLRGGVMAEHVTECQACHKAILCEKDEYPRFCTYCGQAIDWSEVENEIENDD